MSLSTKTCSSMLPVGHHERVTGPRVPHHASVAESEGQLERQHKTSVPRAGLPARMAAMDDDLLARLERYYDEAPRANADTEEHGPFTRLRVARRWPYYARPRLGLTDDDDARRRDVGARPPRGARAPAVDRVGARRRRPACGRPRWPPGSRSGTTRCSSSMASRSRGSSPVAVRRIAPDDPDLAAVQAAIHVGFGQDDTQVGPASVAERDAQATEPDSHVETMAAMIAAGQYRHVRRLRPGARRGRGRQPQPAR